MLCGRDGRAESNDPWLDTGCGFADSLEVDMNLHCIVAFLTSREFAVNFVANLGGAMAGVLLAFWFERIRARRGARMLYGQNLRTSRSELAYLKPMCVHGRDALMAGKIVGTWRAGDQGSSKQPSIARSGSVLADYGADGSVPFSWVNRECPSRGAALENKRCGRE